MSKRTLVIGASEDQSKYASFAIKLLKEDGHDIIALGRKTGKIYGVDILDDQSKISDIDTVSLYINSKIQTLYRNFLIRLNPKRVIFNPGAENFELAKELKEMGIEVMNACNLTMLRTGQY